MSPHQAFQGRTREAIAVGLALTAICAGSIARSEPASASRPAHSTVVCAGAIRHPVSVRVKALDPVRRGASVRLRVSTVSVNATRRAEVRLVSAGGAAVVGSSRVVLEGASANRESVAEFTVQVPAQGRRFLVQFRVTAEGEDGLQSRGATFNLMPDGPAETPRAAVTATGERVLEVPAQRSGR